MNEAVLQVLQNFAWPNGERPCRTCSTRTSLKQGPSIEGIRCLHPMMRSTDVLLGLPPLCLEARQPGMPCGPRGDLHSLAPSATTFIS